MITEDDLYAIGMESQTAWHKMLELCAALGLPFPPCPAHPQKDKKGLPAPVTLASLTEI